IREDPQHPSPGAPCGYLALRLFLVLESRRLSWRCRLADLETPVGSADPQLWLEQSATQETIHDLGHIVVPGEAVALLNFDEHIKGRWRLALQDGLLGAAAPRLLVRQRDSLNTTHEIGEGWVPQQVVKSITVGCGDELDTALSDGARC